MRKEITFVTLSNLQERIVLNNVDNFSYDEFVFKKEDEPYYLSIIEKLEEENSKLPLFLFHINSYTTPYTRWNQTNEQPNVEKYFLDICKLLACLQYTYTNKIKLFSEPDSMLKNIKNENIINFINKRNTTWIYNMKLPVVFY